MTVHGRIAGSSNVTLLVTCALDGTEQLAVYKPARGERPLWDFPDGPPPPGGGGLRALRGARAGASCR